MVDEQKLLDFLNDKVNEVNIKSTIEDFYEWFLDEIDNNIDLENPTGKFKIPYRFPSEFFEKLTYLLGKNGFGTAPACTGRKCYFMDSSGEYTYGHYINRASYIYIDFRDN
jgi:hypothetical protein